MRSKININKVVAISVLPLFFAACSELSVDSIGNIAGDIGDVQNGAKLPGASDVDIGTAVSAGADLAKAATLSDEDVKTRALAFVKDSDSSNRVAPAGSSYAKRLAKLTNGLEKEDGLNLNFKVYLDPEVNAFSTGDGSVRVNSGLLDAMTDDEVLGVIGHEIGHVKLGHSHGRMRTALVLSAARKGTAAAGNVAGRIAESSVGGMAEGFLNAQYSQSDEYDSDKYGLQMLMKHGHNPQGAVDAMRKLAQIQESLGGESSGFKFFATHPGASERAKELAEFYEDETGKELALDTPLETPKVDKSAFKKSAVASNKQGQDSTDGSTQLATSKKSATSVKSSLSVQDSGMRTLAKGYYLQISSETNPTEAESKAAKLRSAGYGAQTANVVVNGTPYTRVLVGPFTDYTSAKGQASSVQATGLNDGLPFVQIVK